MSTIISTPVRVNPIKKQKSQLDKLVDIAIAVQRVRLSTDPVVWNQANHELDVAMHLAGYYTPNGELPVDHVSHIAKKVNEWRDEIKKRDERIKELERIIEKLNPFGENLDPVQLDGKGHVVPTKPYDPSDEFKKKGE